METKLGRSRISLLRLFQEPDSLLLELVCEVFRSRMPHLLGDCVPFRGVRQIGASPKFESDPNFPTGGSSRMLLQPWKWTPIGWLVSRVEHGKLFVVL